MSHEPRSHVAAAEPFPRALRADPAPRPVRPHLREVTAPSPEARPNARLCALVVTYNRLDQIRETVRRLLAEPCDHVYVIDNGSTDGSREWLMRQTERRLRVILTPRNLGGAGGFELGLRRIVHEVDPDWMVLMDDDARPEPGCFQTFLNGEFGDYDAVSAAVYLQNGDICEMNRPTINPFWNVGCFVRTACRTAFGRSRSGFHVSDDAYRAPPMEIDATSFVGLFLSRNTIRRIGYPDGEMFIYGDDVHYTLRLRKAGLTIGFVPALRFEHDYNRTHAGKRGIFTPLWKAYYTARNGIIVYRFAAGPLFWLAILVILPKWTMDGLRYGAKARRAYYRLLWRGVRDGFSGNRGRPHAEIVSLSS